MLAETCCCPEVTTLRLLHVVEVCPLDGDTVVMLCESLLPALLAEAVCFSSSNIVICFVTFVTFMDVTLRSVVGCRLELQALLVLLELSSMQRRDARVCSRPRGRSRPPPRRGDPVVSRLFYLVTRRGRRSAPRGAILLLL